MEVNKICVLGSGIMGRQIAQQAAMCGLDVSWVGVRADAKIIQQGLDAIRGNLQKFYVDKGKMTRNEMDAGAQPKGRPRGSSKVPGVRTYKAILNG